MDQSLSALAVTAISIGTLHTLAGPDHYLPFVALARAKRWSRVKTINVVLLCGLGHVLSSVAIGFVGIAAGFAVSGVERFEGLRGGIAAWLLMLFGAAYMLWGAWRLSQTRQRHKHLHGHLQGEGLIHSHDHNHGHEPGHGHRHDSAMDSGAAASQTSFWVLFAIFVLGPCEPLIPLLMYPAAERNFGAVAGISALFAAATILTMVIAVLLLIRGMSLIRFETLEKYKDLLAGGAIALCGAAIIFLGL